MTREELRQRVIEALRERRDADNPAPQTNWRALFPDVPTADLEAVIQEVEPLIERMP